jgi:hypothetical protein
MYDLESQMDNYQKVKDIVLSKLVKDGLLDQDDANEFSERCQVLVYKGTWFSKWFDKNVKSSDSKKDSYYIRIVEMKEVDLREDGVSGAKAKTILGLGNPALNGEVKINDLHLIDDDQLIYKQLTSLWGIGPWTVDMFLMFQLGRLNVWPTGDLGVRRGWEKIHKLKEEIEPKKLEIRGEKFHPHRSVVAWYCWRAADSKY